MQKRAVWRRLTASFPGITSRLRTIVTIALLLCSGALSRAAPVSRDLRDCTDAGLQKKIERIMQRLSLNDAVAERRLAVSVVNLIGEGSPRLAMLNGDTMMYAASLPKIAILLGAFVKAEQGQLELDPLTLSSLNRMIRLSSNADANAMLAKVGNEAIIDILTSARYCFYDPARGGGLWIGKAYDKEPAYRRDPVHGLSHGATAFQVARFYYMLDRGELLTSELTRQMKAALSDPGLSHKFVKGLESHSFTHLYRKSGTWNDFHSDSVLVEGKSKRYILVGIARDPRGGDWLVRTAAAVDDLFSSQAASTQP